MYNNDAISLQNYMFAMQKIIDNKMGEIFDLLKPSHEKSDDIDSLIDRTNKKLNEIHKDLEQLTPSYIPFAKNILREITDTTRNRILISLLLRWIDLPGNLSWTTALEILVTIMEQEPYEKIYILIKNEDPKVSKKMIKEYFKKVAQIKYIKDKIQIQIDDEFLEVLQAKLKEDFPKVGKSKFTSIMSNKNKENIQNSFKSEGIKEIIEQLIEILEEEFGDFETLEEMIDFYSKYIDVFYTTGIETAYKLFAGRYITQEIEKSNKRKENVTTPKNKEKKLNWQTDMIKKIHEEAEIIKHDEKFLEELFKKESRKKDIVKYILRLHRKGKHIRIADLQEKFSIKEELLTDELVEQAKKINIAFIKNKDKSEPVEEKITKKEEVCHTKECKEKSEKEKIQEKISTYIESKNDPTIDDCMYMLELAGYEFQNKKSFIKQCSNLYKKPKEIREFAQDLKAKVLKLNDKVNAAKKKPYKSIVLEGDKRILFLEKNIIDGIYDHNDYMRRLNNQ